MGSSFNNGNNTTEIEVVSLTSTNEASTITVNIASTNKASTTKVSPQDGGGKVVTEEGVEDRKLRRSELFILRRENEKDRPSFLKFVNVDADAGIAGLQLMYAMTSTIMWMLITYLTDEWKFSFTYAAGIRNVWSGLILALPLILIHIADIFTGDFLLVFLGSALYAIGIGVLAVSARQKSCFNGDNPSKCKSSSLYAGLALTVLGAACMETSLADFAMQDQAMKETEEEKKKKEREGDEKTTEINGVLVLAFFVLLLLMYFNKITSWHTRFMLSAVFMGCTSLVFVMGICEYYAYLGRLAGHENSLIVTISRVLVASASKLCIPHPGRANLYAGRYGDDKGEEPLMKPTSGLCCLDKAATILEGISVEVQEKDRWRLCTVTEVEKTKMVLHMFPVWATCLFLGVVSSVGDTYFLEQANHLQHKLGKAKIPLVILLGFQKLSGVIMGTLFKKLIIRNKYFLKQVRPAVLVAMAMVFSISCCAVAAKVEKKRLGIVSSHGLTDKPEDGIPMSIFELVPQFLFLGGLDALFEEGNRAFSVRFPVSMIRYMSLSTAGINGIGRIGGALSVYIVMKISSKKSMRSWFQDTLNKSRLDQYYWLLAKASCVGLGAFVLVVCCYVYSESRLDVEDGEEADNVAAVDGCHFWCCG